MCGLIYKHEECWGTSSTPFDDQLDGTKLVSHTVLFMLSHFYCKHFDYFSRQQQGRTMFRQISDIYTYELQRHYRHTCEGLNNSPEYWVILVIDNILGLVILKNLYFNISVSLSLSLAHKHYVDLLNTRMLGFLYVLLSLSMDRVKAFSSGATIISCGSLVADYLTMGHMMKPQTSRSPYRIITSQNTYQPGETIIRESP